LLHVLSGVWSAWEHERDPWRTDIEDSEAASDPRIDRLCRAGFKSLGVQLGRAVEKWGTDQDREMMGRFLTGWQYPDYETADAMACRLIISAMANMKLPGDAVAPRSARVPKPTVSEALRVEAINGCFRATARKLQQLKATTKPDPNKRFVLVDLNALPDDAARQLAPFALT
jgi:hypothetical protein